MGLTEEKIKDLEDKKFDKLFEKHLDEWTEARRRNAMQYDRLFAASGARVGLPSVGTDRHVFNQYVIRVSHRNQLQEALRQRGIGTEVYYPVPMHLQECFASLGYRAGAFPTAEACAADSLALPITPELPTGAVAYVVETIGAFYRRTM